jgi:hypothetical protein
MKPTIFFAIFQLLRVQTVGFMPPPRGWGPGVNNSAGVGPTRQRLETIRSSRPG